MEDRIATMSPYEYADYLRREDGIEDSDPALIACEVLAATVVGSLPEGQQQLLSDVHVTVMARSEPNAMIYRVPSGGLVIGLHDGLLSWLLGLNRVLVCRLNSLGLHPTIEIPDASAKAAAVVNHHFLGTGEYFRKKPYPRWMMSPRQSLLASALMQMQVSFVVAHELGHKLAGHLYSDAVGDDWGARGKSPHDTEYEADARGAELVMGAFAKNYDRLFGSSIQAVAPAAIETLFTFFDFIPIANGEYKRTSSQESSTHPNPADRRKELRSRLKNTLDPLAIKLSDEAASIFAALGEELVEERSRKTRRRSR